MAEANWAADHEGTSLNCNTPQASSDLYFSNINANPSDLGSITLGASGLTAASLTFLDDNFAQPVVIGAGGTLTLTGALTALEDATINANVSVSADGITVDTDKTLTLSAGVSPGANDFLKAGAGALTLNGASAFATSTKITGGTLSIESGAAFQNLTTQIGDAISDVDTDVMVTGGGSTLTFSSGSSYLTVGNAGSGNTLTVGAGGKVTTTQAYGALHSYIGYADGADNNAVVVTGVDSIWEKTDTIYIGYSGDGNSLTISDGGAVNCEFGRIGDQSGSDNNSVTITGSGSTWTVTGGNDKTVYIGNGGGSGNHLDINDGGRLTKCTQLYLQGPSSAVNLGNGTGIGLVEISGLFSDGIRVEHATSQFNINSGRLKIVDGDQNFFASGYPGTVSLNGPAYFDSNGFNGSANSVMGGTGGLTKESAGTLTLSQANTYSGDTKIDGGTLELTDNLAIQNSAFDTSGAGVMSLTVTTPTFGGLKGSTALASAITTGYGDVTDLTLNPGIGTSHDYSGAIVDGAAGMNLTKTGTGTQELSGTCSYSGNTTISGGTLTLGAGGSINATPLIQLAAAAPSGLDVSAVTFTLQSGQELKGIGQVTGSVSMDSGSQLTPGSSIGTLTVTGDLTLNSGATYEFELDTTAASDKVLVGGTLDLGSVQWANFTFSPQGGFGSGSYTLFAATTGVSGSLGGSVSGQINGLDATLSVVGNDLVLEVQQPPAHLLGYWNFNEGSGTTANDTSAKGNHGTLIAGGGGAPSWVASRTTQAGNALQFHGYTDRVDVPISTSLNLTSTFTFSMWAQSAYLGGYPFLLLFSNNSAGDARQWFFQGDNYGSDQMYIWSDANGNWNKGLGFPTGGGGDPYAWHHYAFSYSAGVVSVYVDGVAKTPQTISGSPNFPSFTDLLIGGKNTAWASWEGPIDDVLILDRAVSPAELTLIKNGSYPGMIDITSFTFPGLGDATINGTDIDITVPGGTDVTGLQPTYTLSGGVCSPASGDAVDFTTPQTYTVTAGDGVSTKVYTVTVTPQLSSEKDILTFTFPGLGDATIVGTDIDITVPLVTDVTGLAPTYTVSPAANGNPASGDTVDFTNPQTYTITAEDSSTKDYTVTVSKVASSGKDILSFTFPVYGAATINGTDIDITLPMGTDVTGLSPTYTASAGAVGAPASGDTEDFTNPVDYIITAEDTSTKTYTVTVKVPGIVGYWNFNEGVGTTATDVGPQAIKNDGTLYGSPTWIAGHTGLFGDYALNFASDNNKYVQVPIPSGSPLEIGKAGQLSFTVAMWVYNTAFNYGEAWCIGDGGGRALFWQTGSSAGESSYVWSDWYGNYDLTTGQAIPANAWHHIAFTSDGATLQFYYDGVAKGSRGTGGQAVAFWANLFIGRSSQAGRNHPWPGYVDDVIMLDYKASLTEIGQLKDGTYPGMPPLPEAPQPGEWSQTTSGGDWSETGNWLDGIVADGAGNYADFSALDITADNTVHLDTARTIGSMTFGDTDPGTAAGWILDNDLNAANILTLQGGAVITVNALGTGKNVEISAEISGSSGLVKDGAGTLVLSGANTYTGGTTIDGGVLSMSSMSSPLTFNNNGALEYTGASATATLNTGSGSAFAIDVTSGNLTVSRDGGAYNQIAKGGAGTLTIANAGTADGGGLTLNEGTVVLLGTSSYPPWYANVSSIQDVISGATVSLGNSNGGQVYYDSGFTMSGGMFDVNGQNPSQDENGSVPSIAGSGTIVNNSGTAGRAVFKINGNKEFSGNITDGVGELAVSVVAGGGTWTLSGNNTYSGATTLNSGTMQAGSITAFSPNSAYTVNSTLALNGFNNSVGSLAGGGNVTLGAGTLTVGNDGTSPANFSGSISGNGGLTKIGGGTITLTGAGNSYAGDTRVQGGVLSIAQPNLANTADVYLQTGGILNLNFAPAGTVDTIRALYINGARKTGTWGGEGSGAPNQTPLITGDGWLKAPAPPNIFIFK